MDEKMIKDEELEKVTGGANTGDRLFGKVYINSPVPFALPSTYYDCASFEKIADQFYSYKDLIAPMMSNYPDIVNAIKSQYEYENKQMPTKVKEFLGIK